MRWSFDMWYSALFAAIFASTVSGQIHLTSPEDSYIPAIESFGVDIKCQVGTCLSSKDSLKWFRGDMLLAEGTEVPTRNEKKFQLIHNLHFDHTKDCTHIACSRSEKNNSCPEHHQCLQNFCCPCGGEEYILVLKNLTRRDSGLYTCELDEGFQQQAHDFELEVHDSGLKSGFAKNITFDHTACCSEQGMSPKCLGLCKPGALETHTFDPMDCNQEITKFLHCVTEGGNVSHVQCCKHNIIPPFCWRMCSGYLSSIRELPPVCLYWLPEIFQCYEMDYLPIPKPPKGMIADTAGPSSLRVCWDEGENRGEQALSYTVNYRKAPQLPFMGHGGLRSLFSSSPGGVRQTDNPTVLLEEEALPHESMEVGVSDKRQPRSVSYWDGALSLKDGISAERFKRQTWIFVTSNGLTNETQINQLKPMTINTTDTCVTIDGLEEATQYFVDVTSTNEHGTSLPSVRAIVSTEAVTFENASATINKIKQCCIDRGVQSECVPKLCDLNRSPSGLGAVDVALRCQSEFTAVAPCLADGRDHTPCCRSKFVSGKCLKLCDGTAAFMGIESILCLTLDIHSIFSCLREGYVTHPSPPRNVRVRRITSSTAVLYWDPPEENGNKVHSYSLFYRKDDIHLEEFTRIENVQNGYELADLDPNMFYLVYLVAQTDHGSSLKSSIEQFVTADAEFPTVCGLGDALRDPNGRRVYCSKAFPCPHEYDCIAFDSQGQTYCCPKAKPVLSPETALLNVRECCEDRGLTSQCSRLCSYNTTAKDLIRYGPDCVRHVHHWVNCGTDGRDHTPCCVARGVAFICLDFCRPLRTRIGRKHLECVGMVETISSCVYEGIVKLPGPPKNLRLKSVGKTDVVLTWDVPHQRPLVEKYQVKLFTTSNHTLFREVNVTGLAAAFSDLTSVESYSAEAVSWNVHGSSAPSNNISFTTPEDEDPSRPAVPRGVEEVWRKEGVQSNITWSWPGVTGGGANITNFQFVVSYAEHIADKPSIYTNVTTKSNWIVLEDLRQNRHYQIRVVAQDLDTNKESPSSEMLFLATSIDLDSPSSPYIKFSPEKAESHFTVGDEVTISCSSTGNPAPNITLNYGASTKSGLGSVSAKIEKLKVEHSTQAVKCKAANEHGSKISHGHIPLYFAPIVKPHLEEEKTRSVISNLDVEFFCRVESFPTSTVTWYLTEKSEGELSKEQSISENIHYAIIGPTPHLRHPFASVTTLRITDVTQKQKGFYHCEACNPVGCSSTVFTLKIDAFPLPKGPHNVEKCCREQNVDEECMSACTYNIDIKKYKPTCFNQIHKLLHCAKDGADHRECCEAKDVPTKCLGLCDLMIKDDPPKVDLTTCGIYSRAVLVCMQENDAVLPGFPRDVKLTQTEGDGLRVEWKAPTHNTKSILKYAVYYKPVNGTHFKKVVTNETNALIEGLTPGTRYEVTVLAANYHGISPFTSAQSLIVDETTAEKVAGNASVAGSILAIIFCLLLAAVIILGVMYFSRRPTQLPAFFGKLRNRHRLRGAGSEQVTFENPVYPDDERDGQIRGLPGDRTETERLEGRGKKEANGLTKGEGGWERAELESIEERREESPSTPQRGLKYTQLT